MVVVRRDVRWVLPSNQKRRRVSALPSIEVASRLHLAGVPANVAEYRDHGLVAHATVPYDWTPVIEPRAKTSMATEPLRSPRRGLRGEVLLLLALVAVAAAPVWGF